MEKHTVQPEHAQSFFDWILKRGGVAIWRSVDLSDLGASWSTPALQEDGEPAVRPHWKADSKPHIVITDPKDVIVTIPKEVDRFRIAIQRGSGLSIVLTPASSDRVRRATDKANKKHPTRTGSWYAFDYLTQEAIIYVSDKEVPLLQYLQDGASTNDPSVNRT